MTDGRADCDVVEVYPTACRCEGMPGERSASPAVDLAVRQQLRASGVEVGCGTPCVCVLDQLTDAALTACQNDADPSQADFGFCYLDPAQGLGAPALVADCSASSRRRLRYVGDRAPSNANSWFLACRN